ncbi:MAG: HNH endonuclease [Candidatus Colwellbacteria bacterium]|nr:HNH endonuclease [Candidatus Colwellbacteria bacterium]
MSKTKEILFIETDYSCAYCGQKGRENLSIDHIDGRHIQHSKKYDNLIVLCHNCHHRKTKAKDITLEDIKRLKKMLIIKTLTQFGVNALKLAHRNNFGIVINPLFMYHLVDLGLFEQKDVISSLAEDGKEVTTEVLFIITPEGKRICEKWF